MLRLGQGFGLPVIHLVRKEGQVKLLWSPGGEYVLNTSIPDFREEFREQERHLKASLFLDPVEGKSLTLCWKQPQKRTSLSGMAPWPVIKLTFPGR